MSNSNSSELITNTSSHTPELVVNGGLPASTKDLLTTLSHNNESKIDINRSKVTSPEAMYEAFIQWFWWGEGRMPEKLSRE